MLSLLLLASGIGCQQQDSSIPEAPGLARVIDALENQIVEGDLLAFLAYPGEVYTRLEKNAGEDLLERFRVSATSPRPEAAVYLVSRTSEPVQRFTSHRFMEVPVTDNKEFTLSKLELGTNIEEIGIPGADFETTAPATFFHAGYIHAPQNFPDVRQWGGSFQYSVTSGSARTGESGLELKVAEEREVEGRAVFIYSAALSPPVDFYANALAYVSVAYQGPAARPDDSLVKLLCFVREGDQWTIKNAPRYPIYPSRSPSNDWGLRTALFETPEGTEKVAVALRASGWEVGNSSYYDNVRLFRIP